MFIIDIISPAVVSRTVEGMDINGNLKSLLTMLAVRKWNLPFIPFSTVQPLIHGLLDFP
jgi:hypothetical protein